MSATLEERVAALEKELVDLKKLLQGVVVEKDWRKTVISVQEEHLSRRPPGLALESLDRGGASPQIPDRRRTSERR